MRGKFENCWSPPLSFNSARNRHHNFCDILDIGGRVFNMHGLAIVAPSKNASSVLLKKNR